MGATREWKGSSMSWPASSRGVGSIERSAWESTCRAGGKRGDRAQVPEVGKSQLAALMLQGGKMSLWEGVQSDIGIYRGVGVWDRGVTEGMQGHIPWFMGSYLSALNTGE